MARRSDWQDRLSFGGRLPWAVGLVMCLTAGLSLVVALGDRHAGGLFDLAALVPRDVWHGQVWRLATWAFIEPSPLSLIFGLLFLYWFGRDLAADWGSRRFLLVFGAVALAAAAGTCLVAQLDPPVLDRVYIAGWALGCAMVVAWGLWFPDRVVRLYFILPIRAFWIAWLTVAVTVVYAIYAGWDGFLPHLFAQGSILAWLFRRSLAARWSRLGRDIAVRRRNAARTRRLAESAAHLKLIEAVDDDAPLPPEVESKIQDLLSGRVKPKGP